MTGLDLCATARSERRGTRAAATGVALAGGLLLAADPALARLHAQAVDWRHARLAALMEQEPLRALFGRLLMTPPSRPVPLRAAQALMGHARRAQTKAGK